MPRLTAEDFDALFDSYDRCAFRLETRDHYAVAAEAEAYRQFLAGELFDLDWFQPWLATIRSLRAAGRTMQRVRLLSEPPTDYERFELAVTPSNLAAGEDIRLLERSRAHDLALPDHDFWIFDDRRLVVMHFDDTGTFQGADVDDEPGQVAEHQAARDRALQAATPYTAHIASRRHLQG